MEERLQLRRDAARLGLRATIRGRSLQELARELVALAQEGLAARARLDAAGDNETGFLAPLMEIAESGLSPADRKLALFEHEWGGSVDPLYEQFAY